MMTQETDSQVVALDTTTHTQPLSVIYRVIMQSNEDQLIIIIIIIIIIIMQRSLTLITIHTYRSWLV